MRVVSGAGEFDVTIDQVTARDGSLVLAGKMGVWESETFLTAEDLARIMRASFNRPSLTYLVRSLPAALWRVWRLKATAHASPTSSPLPGSPAR